LENPRIPGSPTMFFTSSLLRKRPERLSTILNPDGWIDTLPVVHIELSSRVEKTIRLPLYTVCF
jgi:hypothetical protein